MGRSPVVVQREVEQALLVAKATSPESIHCSGDFPDPAPPWSLSSRPPPAMNCSPGSAKPGLPGKNRTPGHRKREAWESYTSPQN